MKSLSLSRPLVLMMLGAPGAGKSFFARQFAETFGAPLVSLDQIRHTIFAQPRYERDEDSIVQAIAWQQIVQLLQTQKTFIVDGGLSARTDRMAVERLARQQGYGQLIIWVQTDEATSRLRATKRNPKRAGDGLNVSLTPAQFTTQAKKITPPSPQELYVVISGKHTYATQAKVVLKKLVSPRETTIAPQSSHTSAPTAAQPSPPRRRNVIIN